MEEGYCEWQKHALYEQSKMKDQTLQVALCEGFKNTTNIGPFVLLNDVWGTELGRTSSLGPDLFGISVKRN